MIAAKSPETVKPAKHQFRMVWLRHYDEYASTTRWEIDGANRPAGQIHFEFFLTFGDLRRSLLMQILMLIDDEALTAGPEWKQF